MVDADEDADDDMDDDNGSDAKGGLTEGESLNVSWSMLSQGGNDDDASLCCDKTSASSSFSFDEVGEVFHETKDSDIDIDPAIDDDGVDERCSDQFE